MSDPVRSFRLCGDVPLLGDRPPEQGERLRVRLDLEFLPDGIPPDVRLRTVLKRLLRQYRARCLACVDVPAEGR